MGEKSLFLAGEALPADIAPLISGHYEGIIMLHHAVASFAADRWFFGNFRIYRFDHGAMLRAGK